MVAQDQHPGIERARNDRRQKARAGDKVQPFGLVVGDGGTGRCGALSANDGRFGGTGRADQRGHIAERPVQMRLYHMQHEPHGRGGIIGVSATLQQSHAHGTGHPVGGCDHAIGALQLGSCRKRHGAPSLCFWFSFIIRATIGAAVITSTIRVR